MVLTAKNVDPFYDLLFVVVIFLLLKFLSVFISLQLFLLHYCFHELELAVLDLVEVDDVVGVLLETCTHCMITNTIVTNKILIRYLQLLPPRVHNRQRPQIIQVHPLTINPSVDQQLLPNNDGRMISPSLWQRHTRMQLVREHLPFLQVKINKSSIVYTLPGSVSGVVTFLASEDYHAEFVD